MSSLLHALGLLTALPLRLPDDPRIAAAPGRTMWAYPVVGTVIGLALLLVAGLLRQASLLSAAIVLAAWCASTGALHLDGWADCCDALFVPVSRQQRLDILRDPRLGSFGGVGLVLLLLLKLAAIQAIMAGAAQPPWWHASVVTLPARLAALWPLLAAPVIARWCLVLVTVAFPLARPDGMAAFFRRGAGPRELILGAIVVVFACAPLGLAGLVLWAAALLAAWALARLALARLAGLTGDVYGATVELTETVVLVVAALI